MSDLKKCAQTVPTADVDSRIAEYLKNELNYEGSFSSTYTLAEFKENVTGEVWYILDGYFSLPDGNLLFLDFNYNPTSKRWTPINNYSFVPSENKRFLLKAEEKCNPYKRNFIGVVVFSFKERTRLDDLLGFLNESLGGRPMLYSDGSNNMIQDLTLNSGSKPLFTLNENALVSALRSLDYIDDATIIPSGRQPSNDEVTKTYEVVKGHCR